MEPEALQAAIKKYLAENLRFEVDTVPFAKGGNGQDKEVTVFIDDTAIQTFGV